MKPKFFQSCAVLLAAIALASCSGLPKTTTPGGGTGTLSLTMIDTPPANSSILSFQVTITGIALNPATGSAFALTPPTSPVELTRLQSDSTFLGTFKNVPATTYNSITVTLATPIIVLANQTSGLLSGGGTVCPNNSVCEFKLTPTGGMVQILLSPSLTLNSTTPQGLSLDFNLNNAITVTGTTLGVDFSQTNQPNFLNVATLPRPKSNLLSGQLELIEDFTGAVSGVSAGSNTVTITSPTRGALTATSTSSSVFDADPTHTLCTAPASLSACVSNNQIASVDAILNSNGTFAIQEIEPLFSTPQDLIEGVVYAISSTNPAQFQLVVSGVELASSASQLANLKIGDPVQVTIVPNPTGPTFFVDSKHLASASNYPVSQSNTFGGATTNAVLAAGQTVMVHVTAFTAASGSTIAAATVGSVVLRWSRITGTISTVASPSFTFTPAPAFIPQGVPPNASIPPFGSPPTVQTFTNITNFDGVTGLSDSAFTGLVSLRALYFASPSTAFAAAKVRIP